MNQERSNLNLTDIRMLISLISEQSTDQTIENDLSIIEDLLKKANLQARLSNDNDLITAL